jgi:hypothetical protein
MKKISPAMIVALIALFVSLAGNAGAVTYFVTSKQIKDHTIQLRDISPGARFALQGTQGPMGLTGPRGFTGLQGPPGPAGPAGKSFSPYQIEGDLGDICKAIKQIQNNVSPGQYSYWSPDFRYKACYYYY